MRGDLVLIRVYGNRELLRRIWDENSNGVFAVPQDEYERLMAGEEPGFMVGFPWRDVFHPREAGKTGRGELLPWKRWSSKLEQQPDAGPHGSGR
jgi:hypothetical protein